MVDEAVVRFRGSTVTVDLRDAEGSWRSLEAVESEVREKTGFSGLRLIHKGALLSDAAIRAGGRLAVMALGATQTDLNAVDTGAERAAADRARLRLRDVEVDFDEVYSDDDVESEAALSEAGSGFGRVEPLPGADAHAAARRLRRLATDPGVRSVMRSKGWFVPVLAEMYPSGKVGEDPVCVLGLNENKGQRILLRLRTDDLQGFRKHLNVLKVLYHELAHNAISEHSPAFYTLVSAIDREAQGAQGSTLGGGGVVARRRRTRKQGTSGRLGGGGREVSRLLREEHEEEETTGASTTAGASVVTSSLAGTASLTAREEAKEEEVSDNSDINNIPASMEEEEEDVVMLEQHEEENVPNPAPPEGDTAPSEEVRADVASEDELRLVEMMGCDLSAARSALKWSGGDVTAAAEKLLLPEEGGDQSEALEWEGDVTAAAVLPEEGSRQARIVAASEELKAAREAATVLEVIIRNAQASQDPKHRRIRLSNARFMRTAGRHAAAMRLLEAVGFERQGDSGEPHLVLTRNDAALFWLSRTLLRDIIDAPPQPAPFPSSPPA